MNQPLDLDDLNHHLAGRAASLGITAAVRKIPRDDTRVEFEAITWRDGRALQHTASYLISEIERLGPVAVANDFVEAARQALPPGTATA